MPTFRSSSGTKTRIRPPRGLTPSRAPQPPNPASNLCWLLSKGDPWGQQVTPGPRVHPQRTPQVFSNMTPLRKTSGG